MKVSGDAKPAHQSHASICLEGKTAKSMPALKVGSVFRGRISGKVKSVSMDEYEAGKPSIRVSVDLDELTQEKRGGKSISDLIMARQGNK